MAKVDDVKDVVAEDINKVLAREEKIDHLASKFDDLKGDSYQFERGARTVKNQSCLLQ